jgi:hypothetical protein
MLLLPPAHHVPPLQTSPSPCCCSPGPVRFEVLHQGLYLGFKGLRAIDDPAVKAIWHDATINVTSFAGQDAGGGTLVNVNSLFNLGALFVAAGREVAFIGANGRSDDLATLPSARFLHANGPTVMHEAYLHSLNLMVGG